MVSCQALEGEPLHSSFIMAKMAKAAEIGGAVAIRANGYEDIVAIKKDIVAIKKEVNLPVIGIVKRKYEGYVPYITPTMKEVEEVVSAGAEIIAVDGTRSIKPGGISTERFLKEIKNKYPEKIVMADISTFEEGIEATKMGFDLVSTTLSGYTDYSPDLDEPDYELIEKLAKAIKVPLIAEGRIWTPEQAVMALEKGAYAVVVGTAITRPHEITRRFVRCIRERRYQKEDASQWKCYSKN
ncbi:N-acetylmannosamine-6-phosphate 2-epimerase [Caldanaerobacter subterraneus KAk]|uniref:N-acetylmannosamine-6-phosphate 2-epimerase n=1 Tax=Caldanaerobacter subterraneus TaxID=911092 RepID=UPI0032C12A51